MKLFIPILFSIIAFESLNAQTPLEAGVFAGGIVYQGDLSESDIFEIKEVNFAFGGLLRYHFNEKWKVRGQVIYGHISGNDNNANRKREYLNSRGWSFESYIVEATAMVEYHPWGKPRMDNAGLFRPQFSPYLGLGGGFANFYPKVKVKDPLDAGLFPEPERKTFVPSIPIVGGLRWDFNERFIATFEAGWRMTFNDYLDGVSQNGNPDRNDPFIFTGLSLTYFIGYIDRYF